MFTKLKFGTYLPFTVTAQSSNQLDIKGNNPIDVMGALGDNNAWGWDRISQNWKSAYVWKSKIRLVIMPLLDEVAAFARNSYFSLSQEEIPEGKTGLDFQDLVGRPFTKVRVAPNLHFLQNWPITLKMTGTTKRLLGINKETMPDVSIADIETDNGPNKQWYWNLSYFNPDPSNAAVFRIFVFVTYYIVFKNKAQLGW